MNLILQEAVIAVDFDGTCVKHEFPEIGADVPGAVETLRWLQEQGAKIVLWTMRSDQESVVIGSPTVCDAAYYLQHAVKWFDDRGIELYSVNCNPTQKQWTSSPKCYAHLYIDDAAVGCPLVRDGNGGRPFVDWQAVRTWFEENCAG